MAAVASAIASVDTADRVAAARAADEARATASICAKPNYSMFAKSVGVPIEKGEKPFSPG